MKLNRSEEKTLSRTIENIFGEKKQPQALKAFLLRNGKNKMLFIEMPIKHLEIVYFNPGMSERFGKSKKAWKHAFKKAKAFITHDGKHVLIKRADFTRNGFKG